MIGQTISYYRITDKLCEGGMGVACKAEDTRLRRAVPLEFLSSQVLGNTEEQARFFWEAQTTGLLDHPNIATIYSIGEHDGHTFIAMALIDGPTRTYDDYFSADMLMFPVPFDDRRFKNEREVLALLLRREPVASDTVSFEKNTVHHDLAEGEEREHFGTHQRFGSGACSVSRFLVGEVMLCCTGVSAVQFAQVLSQEL